MQDGDINGCRHQREVWPCGAAIHDATPLTDVAAPPAATSSSIDATHPVRPSLLAHPRDPAVAPAASANLNATHGEASNCDAAVP